MKTRPR
ncbi:hypothetical protein R3I94_002499 [Phoxinus phoxinus]